MYFTAIPYVFEIALTTLLLYLYYYLNRPFQYWTRLGVTQVDRRFPYLGYLLDVVVKPVVGNMSSGYDQFPDAKYVGTYNKRTPTLLLRDPDLIETLLTKDFPFSYNRTAHNDPNGFFSKHLLNVQNEQWKSLRGKLNPTFSSGKLKGMHSQLIECGEKLIAFYDNLDDNRSFDIRNGVQRYTMDVIASCAFGLNIDTINNPESEFRTMGLQLFERGFIFKLDYYFRIKSLLRKFKLEKFLFKEAKYKTFTKDIMKNTIEYREKYGVVRNDFLQLTNELLKKDQELIRDGQMSSEDPNVFDFNALVSSAFVFFLAGYETTASAISYALYELALNQQVQRRLYDEVSTILRKYDGRPEYEAIQEMHYLDRVWRETLRMYPPVQLTTRRLNREYSVPGTNLVLPTGTPIIVPIASIQKDPRHYVEPNRFNPDRFDKETNVVRKGIYLPFGLGPRSCIGERLAKIEAKVCLSLIVNKYKILETEKTKVPLKFNRNSPLMTPIGGIWLAFEKRTNDR